VNSAKRWPLLGALKLFNLGQAGGGTTLGALLSRSVKLSTIVVVGAIFYGNKHSGGPVQTPQL
jgi:hypothetical protein